MKSHASVVSLTALTSVFVALALAGALIGACPSSARAAGLPWSWGSQGRRMAVRPAPPKFERHPSNFQEKPVPDPTTVRLGCDSMSVCSGGTTTLITSSGLPDFSIGVPNGNNGLGGGSGSLFLAALIPNTSLMAFTVNGQSDTSYGFWDGTSGKLGAFLGMSVSGTSQPDFSAFQSASSQAGVTASGYTVDIVYLGAFSGHDMLSTSVSGTIGLPAGTILYGFLSNCDPYSSACTSLHGQRMVNSTPLSEAITIGEGVATTPEPGSLVLLGSGLLIFGGALRRRSKVSPLAKTQSTASHNHSVDSGEAPSSPELQSNCVELV